MTWILICIERPMLDRQSRTLNGNQPFNRGRLSTPAMQPLSDSGSFPRSGPHDRVRGGRLNLRREVWKFGFSRLTEVADTVPTGTRAARRRRATAGPASPAPLRYPCGSCHTGGHLQKPGDEVEDDGRDEGWWRRMDWRRGVRCLVAAMVAGAWAHRYAGAALPLSQTSRFML